MPTIAMASLAPIVDFFITEKILDQEEALSYQNKANLCQQSYLEYLSSKNIIPENTIANLLSKARNIPFLDLNKLEMKSLPLELLNEKQIKKYRILPLYTEHNCLFIVTDDPFQSEAFKEIQFQLSLHISIIIVETLKLTTYINKIFIEPNNLHLNTAFSIENEIIQDNYFLELDSDKEFPLLTFIHQIIQNAIEKRVSDIHFEGNFNEYRIRYRIDGLLETITTLPIVTANRAIAAIKVMANLDIAEKRLPQDGSFQKNTIDLRISTCPTIAGEKLVIRILNNDLTKLSMDNLGLTEEEKKIFRTSLDKPQGLILVTGPTGSGKTTTLYTALHYLNQDIKNILTVEDPVEMNLRGINQVNIQTKAGLDFSTVLSAFLRQDPDVIMIGEIRDKKTAEIAIKASLTGHLVLSTLHTNNSVEAITRLLNLGIDRYDLISSLSLIIAQRLIRQVCSCHSDGCKDCNKGYIGRIGLFELLAITPSIAELISQNLSPKALSKEIKLQGMQSLFDSGLKKVELGLTTLTEVKRVLTYEE